MFIYISAFKLWYKRKNSSQLLSYEQKDLSKRKFVFKVLKDSTIALEAHILHFKKL